MENEIKLKVMSWITQQLSLGNQDFDVISCIEDIGLDPGNPSDIEMVDEVFKWDTEMLQKCFLNIGEDNN